MATCREQVLVAVRSLLRRNGGSPVSPLEIIREMQARGTEYPESSIRAEIVSRMCVNAPDNHVTTWPDLFRVNRGLYVLNEERYTTLGRVAAPPTGEQPSKPPRGPAGGRARPGEAAGRSLRFILNGRSMDLSAEAVERRLRGVLPEPVRTHGVRVEGTVYPVKQAFAAATRLDREEFTSQTARRILARLGFVVPGSPASVEAAAPTSAPARRAVPADPRGWPWEGAVQSVFLDWLTQQQWWVISTADTAAKSRGVDVVAGKGARRLGAEVKGWPSKDYADPRRAGEVKRTQPTNQAGVWFAQALLKAMMLRDSHPGHESLIVLPDYPRYRDLARRTSGSRAAAGVHVALVTAEGQATSDSWTP